MNVESEFGSNNQGVGGKILSVKSEHLHDFRMLSVTQPFMNTIGEREDGSIISEIRQTHFILEGGHWEADGSFTFRAGLSGYLAPYSASVSDEGVIYKQEGDMVNHRP